MVKNRFGSLLSYGKKFITGKKGKIPDEELISRIIEELSVNKSDSSDIPMKE